MRENLYYEAGQRIRILRKNQNMTQEELAEKAEISTKFLCEIERGNKGFSAATLYNLAKCLNVSCDYILNGSAISNNKNVNSIIGLFNPQQMDEVYKVLPGIYKLSMIK